ncbi:zinc ribbon domain-containing protein [Helicobacter trogontum]|uniref:zinc ribbon domain-containing protein n=1 Tax=Helicobacter trogontum TaxID=50960 RepID=UPI000CF06C04|nr:C4-type zinc ribbon domain-containing protein [Helicobacter trogontum]
MNKNLEKLIEVNRFDLEVSKYDPLIEQKKAPMNEKILEKTKALKEKQELEALIARSEESLVKNNDEFAVITADIERIRSKIQESKSEKEMKNLDMEEGILREKSISFNNEIEALEKSIQAAKDKIATLDSNVAKLDEEISNMEASCNEAVQEIKKQQDEVSAKRTKAALDMETTVLRLYEKIRKWAGNTSVTSIYKEACGGCFIKLSDKNIADIRRGDEIVHCPHCGRILYDSALIEDKA